MHYKKRSVPELPKKFAVAMVGKQQDGSWVMASNVYLSPSGEIADPASSKYVWIGHVFSGSGVASNAQQCSIDLPLTTDPLCNLMESLRVSMCHNFMPFVLTMASTILALHYQAMLQKLKFCPVPLAFGDPGTGKTTALQCGLSLLGAEETRFYSKLSKEKVIDLCCTSSIPLGVDDPQSKNDISRLIIDLYNGAKSGTLGRGERKPMSTCVIAANFTTLEQQR